MKDGFFPLPRSRVLLAPARSRDAFIDAGRPAGARWTSLLGGARAALRHAKLGETREPSPMVGEVGRRRFSCPEEGGAARADAPGGGQKHAGDGGDGLFRAGAFADADKDGTDAANAFTLLELLVVIAILAILAALLMPALGNAREKGRQAACANNLRQIALVFRMYADDNDGFFPPVMGSYCHMLVDEMETNSETCHGGWMLRYFPQIRLLRCPSYDQRILTSGWRGYTPEWANTRYWTTYFFVAGTGSRPPERGNAMNGRYLRENSDPSFPRAPVPQIKYCNSTWEGSGYKEYVLPEAEQPLATDMFQPDLGTWLAFGSPTTYLKNNHAHGENIAYVDGHVEWKTAVQVSKRFCDAYNYVWW